MHFWRQRCSETIAGHGGIPFRAAAKVEPGGQGQQAQLSFARQPGPARGLTALSAAWRASSYAFDASSMAKLAAYWRQAWLSLA